MVPESPGNDTSKRRGPAAAGLSFVAAVRREQLFDEFESGWQSATRPDIAAFLDRVSEVDRDAVLRELLGIELDQRLRRGEVPPFADYVARFPDRAAVVEAVYRGFTTGSSRGAGIPSRSSRQFRVR